MTAVTTAGLLAGLFGSAFVPAVRAAATSADTYASACDAAADKITDETDGTTLTTARCDFKYTVNPKFTITMTIAANDNDGDRTFTVTGGSFKSVTASAAAATVNSVTIDPATSATATVNAAGNATQTVVIVITLNKMAAGKTATIDVEGVTGDDDGSVTIKSLSTALSKTLSASKTDVTVGADYDDTVASLWTFGWDDGLAGAEIYFDLQSPYDTAYAGTYPIVTATITGPFTVAVSDGESCAVGETAAALYDTTSSALSASATSDGNNDIVVCVSGKNGDSTDAGVGTLTVTAAGVTLLSKRINMLGQAVSMSATKGMNHFAAGADIDSAATLYAAKVTFKDAAGNSLTAAGGLDGEVTFTVDGEDSATVEMGTTTAGYVDYTGLCTGYDSGDKPVIVATYTNPDSETDETATATWSVTCTDADGKITNVKMAASSGNPGSEVKVNLTVVDSEGLACGFGCTIQDATLVTRTPEGTDETDTLTIAAGDALLAATHFQGTDFGANLVDGTAWVKIQTPSTKGTYAAIIDYDDIETGGAVALEGSWTIRLVSSDVAAAPSSTGLTAGAKKLTATADFGATAGGAKIAFTLERSNGTVKTYYRKANANGVATFTLRFNGTYEVTASFGDYITDTVILKK